jgi:hypothetical protein
VSDAEREGVGAGAIRAGLGYAAVWIWRGGICAPGSGLVRAGMVLWAGEDSRCRFETPGRSEGVSRVVGATSSTGLRCRLVTRDGRLFGFVGAIG